MKCVWSFVAIAALAVGGLAITGCGSSSQAGAGSADPRDSGRRGVVDYDSGRPASARIPAGQDPNE